MFKLFSVSVGPVLALQEEKVQGGGFETVAKLSMGQERLGFLMTQNRIILASVSKLGLVSIAVSQLLGELVGVLIFQSGFGQKLRG